MIHSRALLYSMLLIFPVAACSKPQSQVLTVYKSQDCRWSLAWIQSLKAKGVEVRVRKIELMAQKSTTLRVPMKFHSCQTAEIGGYFIEGRVPAEDIRQLLREQPNALGLAVPGMPGGGSGMTQVERRETFNTIIVDRTGAARIFHRHTLQAGRSL